MELKENSNRYPLQKVIDNNRKKGGLKAVVIIGMSVRFFVLTILQRSRYDIPMARIKSAGWTDIGRMRPENEDFFTVNDVSRLYIVADGMGGHPAGDVASRLAAESIRDYFDKAGSDMPEAIMPGLNAALSSEANRLLAAIRFSNRKIHELSQIHKAYWKMGSTVAAVFLTDTTMIAANVGDSPIYRVHDGQIELVSVIHNMAAEMAACGHPEDALLEQYRNVLTKAMGIDDGVEPYICEMPLFDGDIVVMATDGLSNKVSPEEIHRVVREKPQEAACRCLVNLANERGGDDNITVVIIAIEPPGNRSREAVMDIWSKIRYGISEIFDGIR